MSVAAWRLTRLAFVWSMVLLMPLAGLAAPPNATYQRALVDFRSGKFREASAALEGALQQRPENAASELLLARCFYEMGDWNSAVVHAESAVRLSPASGENHLWLARAYGRKAEKERSLSLALKTRHEFEKAVELAPGDIDARRDLMQFYLEAPRILGGGKDKARNQAEAIAALDPVEGALARARYDEHTGQSSGAEEEYRRVLALKPNRVAPYLEVADFYVERKDASGLEAAVARAEKVNAFDPRLDYYRGVVHVLEGHRLTQAERDLKSYVASASHRREYPSQASALNWLGQLYERWGKPTLAMIEYQAALQLDPDILEAREALARLKAR